MVKNVFELYPQGYFQALQNFEQAWAWAETYPFSSLGHYLGKSDFPIIEDGGVVRELFPTPQQFKKHAREALFLREEQKEWLKKVAFEE